MPSSAGAGRSLNSLIKNYVEQTRTSLSNDLKVSDHVYASNYQELSLSEYITACSQHCKNAHRLPCTECTSMLTVA